MSAVPARIDRTKRKPSKLFVYRDEDKLFPRFRLKLKPLTQGTKR